MNPFLSVVILTHNQPRELARLLGSIKSVPEGAEIIVVDDNSDHECVVQASEIIGRFREEVSDAVRYEYCELWSGCGGARNRGADAARGQWIWFVDGDDLIAPDALPRILFAAQRTTRKVLLLNYDIVQPDGKIDRSALAASGLQPWEVGIMAWFKVIHTSVLVRFREQIMCEDNDWWMRQCIHCRNYSVVPGGPCYTYHRLSAGSVTSVIEQLKIPEGADPADVRSLDSFLAKRDPKLTEVIAWLFEDLAALMKVRVYAADKDMPESYFDALDYMIKYFKRLLRVR